MANPSNSPTPLAMNCLHMDMIPVKIPSNVPQATVWVLWLQWILRVIVFSCCNCSSLGMERLQLVYPCWSRSRASAVSPVSYFLFLWSMWLLIHITPAMDHISAGGPWLKYHGHLKSISCVLSHSPPLRMVETNGGPRHREEASGMHRLDSTCYGRSVSCVIIFVLLYNENLIYSTLFIFTANLLVIRCPDPWFCIAISTVYCGPNLHNLYLWWVRCHGWQIWCDAKSPTVWPMLHPIHSWSSPSLVHP